MRFSRVTLGLTACLVLAGCGAAEPSGPWELAGEPVDRDQVESSAGPEHCGWQDAHFLSLSWPPKRTYDDPRRKRTYVRDPKGVLRGTGLTAGFRADAVLPAGAEATGYENDGIQLWFAPSDSDITAYLVSDDGKHVEAWPRDTAGIGCD